ncbi:MAG TPA: D-alanine--D-alanine ligase family protein [Candidatus Limnocylindria bacterium]|nr:D-alanine--D-alanine ligase family protein [Candidatus Limnocylindria bacterium]
MQNNLVKNIGVFFGSGSAEHDISIITAQLIISGLKGLNYQVTPVYITKQGKLMVGEDLGNLKLFTDGSKKVEDEKKYFEYYLDLEESVGKMVFKKKGLVGKSITVDLAFPALHGTYGEDGTIQGMFEMLGVPYVGCGVPASAISMDKAFTKIVMKDAYIPTAKFINFYKKDWEEDRAGIINRIKTLQWPVFVKPVHLGSSIGIAKIKKDDIKDLENKIEVALHYDNKVLVEEGVENLMDVTCCIIGNDSPRASVLQESVFKDDLFNFEDKYISEGGAQTGKALNNLVIPARLDEATTSAIQASAIKVYKALGCSGIARVDFLYNKVTKEFFANEVNPLPGTLYHHLWKASGLELDQLLKNLINYAQEKYEQKRQITFTFESSVLKQLSGSKLGGAKLKN